MVAGTHLLSHATAFLSLVAPGHHLFSNPYREANHRLGASIFTRSKRWQHADTDAYQLNALHLNKQMEGFVSQVFSHVGGEIFRGLLQRVGR